MENNWTQQKRTLRRPDAYPSPLKTKVEALATQLADLSLTTKKNRIETRILDEMRSGLCLNCRKPEYGASRCDFNSHREKKCSLCEKIEHAVESYWARNASGQQNETILA